MKPIAFIDIESTGTDPAKDKIITLAIRRQDGALILFAFNPGMPIPPESTACHGITGETVKGWEYFSRNHAITIRKVLEGSDIAGFNHINFDIPLLWEEMYRVGEKWDLTGVNLIDVGNIFKKMEERTLSAAVKFYCKRDHETAHSADGDVIATKDVLERQRVLYSDLSRMTNSELAEFCRFDDRVDLAGKIVRDKDGDPCYAIGKAKGKKLKHDPGFGWWMIDQSFPVQTKMVVRSILDSL